MRYIVRNCFIRFSTEGTDLFIPTMFFRFLVTTEVIKHILRAKKLRRPFMEISKSKSKTFTEIELTAGQWHLHVLFQESILLVRF